MSDNPSPNLPRLSVTSLSQYVRLENCDRFLRFRLRPRDADALERKWDLTLQPLTPLLKDAGLDFEKDVVRQIAGAGEQVIDLEGQPASATLEQIRQVRRPTILVQASLSGPLGAYTCEGRADVIRLERGSGGRLEVYIADIKASRQERMEHRLQVATYAHLLRHMVEGVGIKIGEIKGGVLHIQEDGSLPALRADTAGFDLDTYLTILRQLAIDEDCTANRIAAAPFANVFYHLGYRCDGCMYNSLCMYDSAERLDLSLTPYLDGVEKKALQEAGLKSLPDLAGLMDLPSSGQRELIPAAGQEARVASLSNRWPLGPKLPVLVQRAKRALYRLDRTTPSASWLYGAGFGTLPSDDEHPDMVKVFFDAQFDYLAGRVYLLAAMVKQGDREQTIVHWADGPPGLEAERNLLVSWVSDILAAVVTLADAASAPIHLYCYNRYDQRVLLDALKRHLVDVASLPGFFDLMTQSPALSQPIISFLATELEERQNLGNVCLPLHDAARAKGFDWTEGDIEFFHLFRARLFDNRRDVLRRFDDQIVPVPTDTPRDDPRRQTIETASRFNSQIPLEYAYGAWGRLPESAETSRLLTPFRQVTPNLLVAFAGRRVAALAHIEASFSYKARFIEKPPINLRRLAADDTDEISPARSLQEFLYMEHHASLQAKLQTYSLPIQRRVQTGLALLLRHECALGQNLHRFAIAFDELGLDPVLTMNAFRMKEGDWVVVSRADTGVSANKIKNGRLGVIKAIAADALTLELLEITFWGSKFRYPHDKALNPLPGHLYTLDDSADDMNADKALEALVQAQTNVLYHWLLVPPPKAAADTGAADRAAHFADVVDAVAKGGRLTIAQREAIIKRLQEPLFLIQGPPGTGKSYTLGWVILSRMILSAAQGRPCRVYVSCKTHKAVNIVLDSVAKKVRGISTFNVPSLAAGRMQGLKVHKVVNDTGDDVPDGVHPLQPYVAGSSGVSVILREPFVVIGGTPGGLHTLMKKMSGSHLNWQEKAFDLVVIDEASQMSVPEGLLACSFLKSDGRVIVVGDHRQMPPIIAHTWKEEEKRTVTATRPYLSLFEFLIERGFPRTSLDESFRLHRVIARFLQENIYVHDDIRFFSKRTDLLTPPPPDGPFVNAVLDPNYPIVVIEHGEQGSHQYNEVEIELVAPLIEICAHGLRLDGLDGIGVVVPHRAQKSLLRTRFPELARTDSIDTVERFQGGERDVIIVSATASDPGYVLAEADFLLNLNRLNVALSRPRKKLIVVASRSVTQLLCSDLDVFENAVLWKRLYYQYAADTLWAGDRHGVSVIVRGTSARR